MSMFALVRETRASSTSANKTHSNFVANLKALTPAPLKCRSLFLPNGNGLQAAKPLFPHKLSFNILKE